MPRKDWKVRFLQDMPLMTGTPPDDDTVRLEALLAIKPSGGEEGSFRFTLAGTKQLDMMVPVDNILPFLDFKGLYIEAQLELGTQVKMLQIS